MKNNVIKLFNDAPSQLRAIADEMEADASKGLSCTVIWGRSVYQCEDERVPLDYAVSNTLFNCQYAIHALMRPVLEQDD